MKTRDDEKLDRANMLRVISLLEPENSEDKPITKKSACEILNISYNTTRLNKLITDFKAKEKSDKKMRAKLRGTPLSDAELRIIAQEYLNGESLSSISQFTYRSTALIKKSLFELGIPERDASHTYVNPPLLNPETVKEDYEINDLVYAARYGEPALVDKKYEGKEGPIYAVYILGRAQCSAMQPFWELSDLTKVQKELGIDIKPQPGMQPSYNPKLIG